MEKHKKKNQNQNLDLKRSFGRFGPKINLKKIVILECRSPKISLNVFKKLKKNSIFWVGSQSRKKISNNG
jgi:hypothetical protein